MTCHHVKRVLCTNWPIMAKAGDSETLSGFSSIFFGVEGQTIRGQRTGDHRADCDEEPATSAGLSNVLQQSQIVRVDVLQIFIFKTIIPKKTTKMIWYA